MAEKKVERKMDKVNRVNNYKWIEIIGEKQDLILISSITNVQKDIKRNSVYLYNKVFNIQVLDNQKWENFDKIVNWLTNN